MDKTIAFLARAIRERMVVRIRYAPGWREIEPHVLGYSAQNDVLLRAFQRSGASTSAAPIHWKIFRVDRIGEVEATGRTFDGPAEGYAPRDPIMHGRIIAQL